MEKSNEPNTFNIPCLRSLRDCQEGTVREKRSIIINEFYEQPKPDFMTKKRLAEELCRSTDYIDDLIKKMVLREEIHFTREGRTLTFYYPQIKKDLAPNLASVV